jgi:hypothetical protein
VQLVGTRLEIMVLEKALRYGLVVVVAVLALMINHMTEDRVVVMAIPIVTVKLMLLLI